MRQHVAQPLSRVVHSARMVCTAHLASIRRRPCSPPDALPSVNGQPRNGPMMRSSGSAFYRLETILQSLVLRQFCWSRALEWSDKVARYRSAAFAMLSAVWVDPTPWFFIGRIRTSGFCRQSELHRQSQSCRQSGLLRRSGEQTGGGRFAADGSFRGLEAGSQDHKECRRRASEPKVGA